MAASTAVLVVSSFFAMLATSPTEAAPVGQGFNLNRSDLRHILRQIKISEQHVATRTPANPCATLLGPGPNQIPNQTQQGAELPLGLRTVDGTCNNLLPGQEKFGAADTVFPRMVPARLRDAENGTSYTQTSGTVVDSKPRTASNLIVDQTAANPAAIAASGGAPADEAGNLPIGNVAPDVGLSAPFNSLFTFFGQFFDHGLDLVTKGGGTVFMPLKVDDPLYDDGPDDIAGNADDPPTNFMVLTRATNQPGGVHEHTNTTTSFVDQNQTYTSHPSHQVFLREYEDDPVTGVPVDNGRMIGGENGEGLATWAIIKEQALTQLGIVLEDTDVLNVPLLATDPYGNFTPGPNGYPRLVLPGNVLLEGSAAGTAIPADALRTGHSFLDDIAHHAVPRGDANPADGPGPVVDLAPDADPGTTDDHNPATYDDEMLDAHFTGGDGRANENIGLTTVHHVFHSEHNRLAADIDSMIQAWDGTAFQADFDDWHATDNDSATARWSYGQRLFAAARFVTEMEYQHLVFEEFARKIQPMVNLFGEAGVGYHTEIDPSIRAEFAHTVYRFGHSMLSEVVPRRNANNSTNDIGLIEAFLNPPSFLDGGPAGTLTPDQAAGAVVRGVSRQAGNQIDEFVVEALRNNLLGLPLDLPTINMARGRDTGVPSLNEARRAFFAESGNSALQPYESWADFHFNLRTPESLANYIAAYGTHETITSATTIAGKREAAQALIDDAASADPAVAEPAYNFLNSVGQWANDANGVNNTGLEDIDLWVGGMGEKPQVFGGMLGSTHNYVFEKQLEDLQDGDRFYYLSRTAGLNLLTQLEGNSFSELVMRNTDVEGLPADAFSRPDFVFDMRNVGSSGPITDDPLTEDWTENTLLTRMANGTVRFGGGEHTVFNGKDVDDPATTGVNEANDRMWASEGDDTLRGNGGADWIQGGDGNDNHIGGLGDDTLLDLAGDDVIKGGDGNDAISSGQGFGGDLNQGGRGNDFIVSGNDITESFGGPGDDFVFAGDAEDTVFGDDGDDWIEGGKGPFNFLNGDNGAPFADDLNEPGHDVLMSFGGEQDYDAEGGDDIMFAGGGIQRSEGHMGFDWVIHKDDPLPADSDMEFSGLLPESLDNNRDRFDFVESLSGWNRNDILRGDDRVAADRGPEHSLTTDGVARISGLGALVPATSLPYNAGNIIIGGAGDDLIEGRAGDDIIDGDSWLNVRLSVRNGAGVEIGSADNMGKPYLTGSTTTLQAAVLAGTVNPGNIVIVREILGSAGGNDAALFSGPRADYDVTFGPNAITVAHTRGTATDGTDRVTGVEQLRFANGTPDNAADDQVLNLSVPATITPAPVASAGNASATVTWTAPADNGSPPVTGYEIVVSNGTVIPDIPAGTTSRVVTGLTNGTAYTFRVRARNVIGVGVLSAPSNSVTPAAPVGPQIVSRVPDVNAVQVAVGANVDTFFSEPMAGNGFQQGTSSTTVRLTNQATGAVVPANVNYNGNLVTERRLRINPTNDLAPATTYTVTLTGGPTAIRSQAGVPFVTTSWSFTTVTPIAPTVTTTTPLDGAVGVARGADITADFSVPVTGVNATTVVLTRVSTGAVIARQVTLNAAGTRVRIDPNNNLAAGAQFRVTLTGGATAIRAVTGGVPLVTRSWTFTAN